MACQRFTLFAPSGTVSRLGFMKSTDAWPFGSRRSYGAPGSGGSLGFADPEHKIGYAYVTSKMGTALTGDPRDVALRDALDAALQRKAVAA